MEADTMWFILLLVVIACIVAGWGPRAAVAVLVMIPAVLLGLIFISDAYKQQRHLQGCTVSAAAIADAKRAKTDWVACD